MSTERLRQSLSGSTMGTRWATAFIAPPGNESELLRQSLQAAVDQVDAQMSPWKADSALMRLNRAAVGIWQTVPDELFRVLQASVRIGARSSGLFDIGVGDLVSAWGFGARGRNPDEALIRTGLERRRKPAHVFLELDAANRRVRRHAPEALDLCGIAKGFAVDEMLRVVLAAGITDAVVSIDGEVAARGRRPDGAPWAVAVEAPMYERREALGVLELADRAVATSGDYRQWVEVGGLRLCHTMDPRRGGPVRNRVASVSVVRQTCIEADAWATALMVAGEDAGPALAREQGLDALFLLRDGPEVRQVAVGELFAEAPAA